MTSENGKCFLRIISQLILTQTITGIDPSFMASNRISPFTMCLSITFFNASWLSSLESKSKNATFLGAKTVKEPSPFRVSNRPALLAVLPKYFREKDGLTNAASRMLEKNRHRIECKSNPEFVNPDLKWI